MQAACVTGARNHFHVGCKRRLSSNFVAVLGVRRARPHWEFGSQCGKGLDLRASDELGDAGNGRKRGGEGLVPIEVARCQVFLGV